MTITGFDLSSYKQCLQRWNSAVQTMNMQCEELGPSKCLPVYYEQLVLHPREWMVKILNFLNLEWHDAVLHHEEHINKPGGVSLSKYVDPHSSLMSDFCWLVFHSLQIR